MIINNLSYEEKDLTGNVWSVKDFTLGKVNLIVGQNSTGKTRILNVLTSLSACLAGERAISNGSFEASFENDESQIINYSFNIEEDIVTDEELLVDDEVLLHRDVSGKGKIRAAQLEINMDFQIPTNNLAAVQRRDAIQHPFVEQLFTWGKSVRHYQFGSQLGKDTLVFFLKGEKPEELNAKDNKSVIAFFRKAEKEFGENFSGKVLNDINGIGYDFSEVGVGVVENVKVSGGGMPSNPEGLYLKEKSHSHIVNQTEMSQGLFRALSLFVQLRYSELYTEHSLILIDDIGEGLDFERSTKLISSIVEIANSSDTQLVMSTNDRFVMNNVPLEYWCIVRRDGGDCTVMNYRNSKDLFDNFEFTGLSNFDFFSTKYYAKDMNGA